MCVTFNLLARSYYLLAQHVYSKGGERVEEGGGVARGEEDGKGREGNGKD